MLNFLLICVTITLITMKKGGFLLEGTFWAILPPIIAIGLALITKEVYFSLLLGIFTGAMFYTQGNLFGALETIFNIIGAKVSDNMRIIIFLILLGMIVALVNKSGASAAYGNWASKSIKSQKGASLATIALGVLIFVDDYFNCLTVGTVMSPVTDEYKITRAKLAYIIDATAAPVCIIAPVSSWAAAVSSSLPEGSGIEGFSLFLRTIPYNLYAWLTLIMLVFMVLTNLDFSKMGKYIKEHENKEEILTKTTETIVSAKGKVMDLLIPIISLIVFCILAMLYTGGFFEGGVSIIDGFANCSSALSLVLGAVATLIVTAILYVPRKIASFKDFSASLVEGFKAMVPAILILTFAWTLSGVCSEEYLNLGGYVSGVVSEHMAMEIILPALFYLIALGLAFATGTSWGTFAILIPITVAVFGSMSEMMVMTIAAVLAGAVCGDHISPISDTTIMSSTGAQVNHIDHVSTQIPYAMLVSLCCVIGYIIGGVTNSGWIALISGIVLLLAILTVIKHRKASAK